MAPKVDDAVLARMKQLKVQYGLANPIIAERLGLSTRTVRAYLNAKEVPLGVPTPDHITPGVTHPAENTPD